MSVIDRPLPLLDCWVNPVASETGPCSGAWDRALVCLSHLRWDLVYQRPQHLMTRFARITPVYFVEEPAFEGRDRPHLKSYPIAKNLTVLVPHFPSNPSSATESYLQNELLTEFFVQSGIEAPAFWFYTPMALGFSRTLPRSITVYDCMDELSGFRDAPPELEALESELLRQADLVFTGGASLYEAKRDRHPNVYLFPSAVDAAHFKSAREPMRDPAGQAEIPHPRIGFFGAVDERLDLELMAAVARLRPDWQLILVGPVIKIDPATLPQAPNLHYLGATKYEELPAYIANWDAAMMPFARNRATRFISPTKTPEYLAAGKPVISTPITDVVRRWGHLDAVRIAARPCAFVNEMATALSLAPRDPHWLAPVDRELEEMSWDRTWAQMFRLIDAAYAERHGTATMRSALALPCGI